MTILAPTDAAFGSLPEPELRQLLGDRRRLRQLLLGHLTAGALYSARLASAGQQLLLQQQQSIQQAHQQMHAHGAPALSSSDVNELLRQFDRRQVDRRMQPFYMTHQQ